LKIERFGFVYLAKQILIIIEMNFKIFVSILFAISFVHAQATQLEVLQAINFARTNPEGVLGSLVNRITRLGQKGIEKDENCW